jgi:alanine-glyoxylate transaminase/serine-glyoxylate transaminase/serine-pyruvate transaminase
VQAAVEAWSAGGQLGFLVQVPQARSVSVTTILLAPGVSSDDIRTIAREHYQVSIAGGLGPFQGRVIRIGHLGDLNPAMILGCLAGVEAALRKLGIAIGDDGLQRAMCALED